MSTKVLGDVFEAAEILGVELIKNEKGTIKNRSTCYDVVRRLPPSVKVQLGHSLRVNIPKLQKLIDRGGQLSSESEAA